MAIYEYECQGCGVKFALFFYWKPTQIYCPECHSSNLKRWYENLRV